MTIYHVKPGDWLSKIATKHGKTQDELLEANPKLQVNPDHIVPGQQITIPQSVVAKQKSHGPRAYNAVMGPSAELPSKTHYRDSSSVNAKAEPGCQTKLFEVVHITGDDHLYFLDQDQLAALCDEITAIDELMADWRRITSATVKDTQASESVIEDKKAWLLKAEAKGLVALKNGSHDAANDVPKADDQNRVLSEEDIQGLITGLESELAAVNEYQPFGWSRFHAHNYWEENWQDLKCALEAILLQKIDDYKQQLSAVDASGKTLAKGLKPDSFYRVRSVSSSGNSFNDVGVVELVRFGSMERWFYVGRRFFNQVKESWSKEAIPPALKTKMAQHTGPKAQQAAKVFFDDIKNAITDDRKKSALGNIEVKVASWSSDKDNAFNVLHKELGKFDSSEGKQDQDVVVAVNAEAHMMRFAAAASAGVNRFDASTGEVNIGVKGNAAFSLLEGKVSFDAYVPDKAGLDVYIAYRNAEKKTVYHRFGAFRLYASIELSCFAGARVAGQGGVTLEPIGIGRSGATALLSPAITLGPSKFNQVGISGEAFAGAETGGMLTGQLGWLKPEDQCRANADFKPLVEIKAEGNVAFAAAAQGDFYIEYENMQFRFHCSGKLAFGPGAGGGFGTVVDGGEIMALVELVCETLAEVDYRYLCVLNKDAFEMIQRGLLKAFIDSVNSAGEVFARPMFTLETWWEKRQAAKQEATQLAKSILAGRGDIQLGQLPPETLGMMLDMLQTTYWEMKSIEQEKAIVALLAPISSWRQFAETLAHMSPDGSKTDSFDSLERLNSLLSDAQQAEFTAWIRSLRHRQPGEVRVAAGRPYTPMENLFAKLGQVERQMLALHQRSGGTSMYG